MPWLRSLLVLGLACSAAGAADWPQWLGPHRDGSSPETVAPWKESPKVLWSQSVGEGHSSPVVAGGRVFLHTRVKDKDEEQVTAWDPATGKELWHATYPREKGSYLFGNGPRATPTVIDGKVYTLGLTGVLSCFDAENGKQLWQIDTVKKYAVKLGLGGLVFGVSTSPLVDGNSVIVNVGGKGASVVAFDKDKGDVLWKNLDDAPSYSSPILVAHGTTRQAVFLTHEGVVSLNPADGSLYWRYPLADVASESATTPVCSGDMLLVGTITLGSVGLRLGTRGNKADAEKVWAKPDLTCYFSTPVPVGKEHTYLATGIKPPSLKREATLRCIETATGKELWQRPKVGRYHASLLRTGDDKLLMLEDTGNLVLLDPDPKEYRELARARVCGETWAHPALADGRLYVRDGEKLYCLELAK